MQSEPLKPFVSEDINDSQNEHEKLQHDKQNTNRNLSVSADTSQITAVPYRVLKEMFAEAEAILKEDSSIVSIPGQLGTGFFVLNRANPSDPRTMKYNATTKNISCGIKCYSWNGYKFCGHVIALGEHLGVLSEVIQKYNTNRRNMNLSKLSNTNMSSSRGKKASKATERRKRPANKTRTESLEYLNEDRGITHDISQGDKLMHLTFIAGLIRKCYGCGQCFADNQRVPPNDMILKTFQHRRYQCPITKVWKTSANLQNTYYHLNVDCVRKYEPRFEMRQVIIHDEIKDQLKDEHFTILRKLNIQI